MKTNCKIQKESISELKKWSKAQIDQFVDSIQRDIHEDIFDRLEWDWEFKQRVDNFMKDGKVE